MYISPSILLLLLALFVFFPSMQVWVTQGGTEWYRPYQAWLVLIVIIWWAMRRYQAQKITSEFDKERDSNDP